MQTKRIEIIPALHGKLTRDGKLSEPDIYYSSGEINGWSVILRSKAGRQEIRIVRGQWTLREGIENGGSSHVSAIEKRRHRWL